MKKIEIYEPAIDEDAFKSSLRNVRVYMDGTAATFDLIPSIVLDQPAKTNDSDVNRNLAKILSKTRPIVEDSRFMRVYFSRILAITIQEESIQIIESLEFDLNTMPLLLDKRTPCPFLRVKNSEWKSRLPEYQGRDHPDLAHFKIISMETCIDVLGYFEKIEWQDRLPVIA